MLGFRELRDAAWAVAGWIVVMEPLSLIPLPGSCLVDPNNYGPYYAQSQECPALHVFLIKYGTSVIEKLGDPNWVIAIFSGALVFSTVLLWRSTRDVAQAGQRSSEIAERALTELEAPFISINVTTPGLRWDSINSKIAFGNLSFTYVNYGRTPAMILEGFEDIRVVDIGVGLPLPINDERGPPLPWGVIAPPNGGDAGPFRVNIFAHMFGAVAEDSTLLKKKAVFFLGFVKYSDIFGNLYTQGFCFLFDHVSGNRWIEAGDERYSYCHKEKGPYRPPEEIKPPTFRTPPNITIDKDAT